MKLRTSLDLWRWLLLSSISTLTACGGDANGMTPVTGGTTAGGSGSGASNPGGGQTGVGGTMGSGGSSNPVHGACLQPERLGGGWERCEDGTLHRPAPASCPVNLPTAPPAPTGNGDTCTDDGDCTEAAYGYCGRSDAGGFVPPANHCRYGCESDSDCSEGNVCLCGEPVGRCVPAECTSDRDCAGSLRCVDYVMSPGCPGFAFACESPTDECSVAADCDDGADCALQSGRHVCQPQGCAVGRPFLVEGEERLALLIEDDAWIDPQAFDAVDVGNLSGADRELIARAWAQVGLMEHASIAAFARFAMQLLHLGAPPSLVEACQQAIADETRHARLCFSFASAYAGRPLGPGNLETSHALDQMDLRSVVLLAVEEGCVGETIAAIEAAEAAEHCEAHALQEALRGIARDEQRHADLAWKFVAWALDRDPVLRHSVHAAFAERIVEQEPASARVVVDPAERQLPAHGHLPAAHRIRLRAQVLQEVIAPAAAALVGDTSSQRSTLLPQAVAS